MNRQLLFLLIAIVLVVSMFTVPVAAKSPPGRTNTPVYYLSLGTSLAAGVQADPVTGESIVTDVSYPGLLAEYIGEDIKKLRHKNLGCPGETSYSFIEGGGQCKYPHGSQLDQAVNFLHAHGKLTGLITIDIGANDVLGCVDGANIDLECFAGSVADLVYNLSYILETLREAAGPNVPIVGMNYYNPLLVYWFIDPAIAPMLVLLQGQINSALENVFTFYEVPVADVAGAFMSEDLVTDDNGNFIPDSVDLLCYWTWMCTHENIHPNALGYAEIADAFDMVLPSISIPEPPRRRYHHGYR